MTDPIEQRVRDLLPCPFCGSENLKIYANAPSSDVRPWDHVACLDCGCGQSSIEKWNHRASTSVEQPSAPEPVTALIASACRDPSFVEWALHRYFVLVPRDPTPEMLVAAGTIDGYDGDDPDADHINWWHVMLESAPAAPRSDDAPREAISAEAVREAWRAAITLGNNICVQESDRENASDGDIGWINGTAECAKRIRDYAEPAAAQLVEMLNEAGAHNALAAFSATDPREAAQEPGSVCAEYLTAPQRREGSPLRLVTDEDVDAAVAAYIRTSGEQGSVEGVHAALESFRARLAGEGA